MKVKIIFVFGILLGIVGLILAAAPDWINGASDVNYTVNEDSVFLHNFSANITGFNNDVTFAIDTQSEINWTNSTGTYSVSASSVSAWISMVNSSTGNFTINATYDNQTGFFVVPIQATNTSGGFQGEDFEFMVNATNDFPNLTNVNSTYNLSLASPLFTYLNATDEEGHYPLIFNVSFNSTNCVHAEWSGYNNNENCSLVDFGFNLTHPSNITALMNFSPTSNHVGVYYANISVRDWGENYSCPHSYCVNSTYKTNKTTYYSQVVTFNVLSSLEVNTTNCDNKVFQENQSGACNITIRTKGSADSLNFSSYSILRNYNAGQSGVSNTSWFYPNSSATSSNFVYNITVNITPQKTEIGNWTINFTVNDTTHNESSTSQIYVYVNKTLNDIPDLESISNVNTSVNLLTVINLSVYDDDLLIPDKNSSYGGFNETTNLTRVILNRSNPAQQLTLSNFSITILTMPSSGTNRTTAEIRFTPNSSDIGDYMINVTANDSQGTFDFGLFNLSIINNSAPEWASNIATNFTLTEDVNFALNLSQNVSDSEGDTLTFSYTNDTSFANFALNSTTGVINFTPLDADVGQHLVNITVSDGFLTDVVEFNLTVSNVNDNSSIAYIGIENATSNNTGTGGGARILNGNSVNLTEDNYTTFHLYIDDNDVLIPSGQKSFYNETFTVNLTLSGPNSSLINLVYAGIVTPANRTSYDAFFTPGKSDVGAYNVTLNITDNSSYSTWISFTMNITAVDHSPVLSSLSNQSSGVNRTLYYDINVTDTEDGNDTSSVNSNFTFSITNLSGNNIFANYFNSTTGIFNITFNDSHSGSYRISVSVNDSGGLIDSENFWIYVYGPPNVSFPTSGYTFNLTENSTSVLNFTVNHSVGDNLTYAFYIDGIVCPYQVNSGCNYSSSILRNLTNYYGNGTSYNFSFTPNLTDETYDLLKNLTLVVYPNSSSLENASLLNTSVVFKLEINHSDASVSLVDNFDDVSSAYGTDITIDLYDHFSDIDHNDSYYNESVNFTRSISTSSITSSLSAAGVLTLSASSEVSGTANVTAVSNSSSTNGNNFDITFTEPTVVTTSGSSSGGSGTVDRPVSLKLILPDPVSAFQKDKIVLPIILHNTGSVVLYDVSLSASVAYNGSIIEEINLTLDEDHFGSIQVGEKKNVTLTALINTDKMGLYEITVNARVGSPAYNDWGKIYLTIKEGENVEEKILFTEEFLISNPECVEIKELIDEARVLLAAGDSEAAVAKSDEALQACKEAIAQPGKSVLREVVENKIYRYLAISTATVLAVGVAYYSYRRIKLKRIKGTFVQEDIKNRKYLERQYGR